MVDVFIKTFEKETGLSSGVCLLVQEFWHFRDVHAAVFLVFMRGWNVQDFKNKQVPLVFLAAIQSTKPPVFPIPLLGLHHSCPQKQHAAWSSNGIKKKNNRGKAVKWAWIRQI